MSSSNKEALSEKTNKTARKRLWDILIGLGKAGALILRVLPASFLLYVAATNEAFQSILFTSNRDTISWALYAGWSIVVLAAADLFITLKGRLADPLIGKLRLRTRKVFGQRLQRIREWFLGRDEVERRQATTADEPVEFLYQDQLNFVKYAYVLATNIVECETPHTIGIHGDWGTGKTSLAKLVQDFLKQRDWNKLSPDDQLTHIREQLADAGEDVAQTLSMQKTGGIVPVNLNAWQYGSSNALWRAFILTLTKELKRSGRAAEAKEWERRLYCQVTKEEKGQMRLDTGAIAIATVQTAFAWLGTVLLPSNVLQVLIRFLGLGKDREFDFPSFDSLLEAKKSRYLRKQMQSVEEFRSALQRIVELLLSSHATQPNGSERIVIYIDDLDRCLPSVALEIMETIKTFLDVKRCVFVLLCDQRLLGQGIREKFVKSLAEDGNQTQRRGREYVEKIIQVSFNIPPADTEILRELAQSALPGSDTSPYFNIVQAAVGNNPRKIKRILRGLNLSFKMMRISTRTAEEYVDDELADEETKAKTSSPQSILDKSQVQTMASESTTTMDKKTKIRKNIDPKKAFAKVYCLQYSWPEAIAYLNDYSNGISSPLTGLEDENIKDYMDKEVPTGKGPVHQILRQLLAWLEAVPDLEILHRMMLSSDWEKAQRIGSRALNQINPELWRFLKDEPYFVDMDRDQLSEFIEWSGTISAEHATTEKEQPSDQSQIEQPASVGLDIDALGKEYAEIRNKLAPGIKRTRTMTGIVTQMEKTMEDNPPQEDQIPVWLKSIDDGQRILGITYLRHNPKVALYDDLLKIIEDPKSGFEQYQALLAMERVARRIDDAQQEKLIAALKQQMDYNPEKKQWLEPGSDRYKIAERILTRILGEPALA